MLAMLMMGMNFGNGVQWSWLVQQVMSVIAIAGLIGGPIVGLLAALRILHGNR